ncbi:hypothetical protein CEXT_680331 [Caerostris extrusa]|uniref:Uncharacterized protein n=1 Tax=Caerostris extrusa TaxID=172846 RepID=A0AAV4XF40_CAEEX|nr:hypothetical protein CEXT_680331 [Caerostris extrusa]
MGPVICTVNAYESLLRNQVIPTPSTSCVLGQNHFHARWNSSAHCKDSDATAEDVFRKRWNYQPSFSNNLGMQDLNPCDFCGLSKECLSVGVATARSNLKRML